MADILSRSVGRSPDGETWDFQCPSVAGSPCGGEGGPFSSTGWPTRKVAEARGRQHFDEHKGLGVSQSLEEFRADQGLVVADDGSVSVEDL